MEAGLSVDTYKAVLYGQREKVQCVSRNRVFYLGWKCQEHLGEKVACADS